MPTVVLGYVPKPEGEAALAASISEARLREADLVVVNAHRAHHGDAGDGHQAELDDVRARVEAAGVASTSATPRPASRPPRTSSPSPRRWTPS